MMEIKKFMGLVANMRQAQKNYFQASYLSPFKTEYLTESKKLEKQVDEQIIKFNSNQIPLL